MTHSAKMFAASCALRAGNVYTHLRHRPHSRRQGNYLVLEDNCRTPSGPHVLKTAPVMSRVPRALPTIASRVEDYPYNLNTLRYVTGRHRRPTWSCSPRIFNSVYFGTRPRGDGVCAVEGRNGCR
jgi:uncharacterized circularly permuted ATP-grasp superfamily protein